MTCVQPPQDTWAQGFNCALVLGDLIFARTHAGSHQSRALHTPRHPCSSPAASRCTWRWGQVPVFGASLTLTF